MRGEPLTRYARRHGVPQAIADPAIVTPRSEAASAIVQRGMKPGNDNPPVRRKSGIVQATKPKGQRSVAWVDDGQEASPAIKAWFAKNVRPRDDGGAD